MSGLGRGKISCVVFWCGAPRVRFHWAVGWGSTICLIGVRFCIGVSYLLCNGTNFHRCERLLSRTRRLLRGACHHLCHFRVLSCRAALTILLARVTMAQVLTRMVGRLTGDHALVVEAFLVASGRRDRSSNFRRCFFRPRPFDRSTRECSARGFRPFKEGLSRAILRPYLRDRRILVRFRSIRFAVGRRAFTTTKSVLVKRGRFRVAFRLAFVRGILTASFLFSHYLRLLYVGVNGLVLFRLFRHFNRCLLVDFVARVNGRTALLHPRRVSYSASVRVLRNCVSATTRVARVLGNLGATLYLKDR